MFSIFGWCVYGLLVGCVAKMLHPGKDPSGCLYTILTGVAGSFLGGFVNYLLGKGTDPFQASGFFMSVIGGVLALIAFKMLTKPKE